MPYIHLANGETKHLSNDEMSERFGDDAPRVFIDNNKEMTIVGIYPDDVELEQKEEGTPGETSAEGTPQTTEAKHERPPGGTADYTRERRAK